MKDFKALWKNISKNRLPVAMTVLTLILILVCVAGYAQGTMYPHTEVEMELTREEGETKSFSSGRIWKTISGTACRQDMEHGELRYSIYLPEGYDSNKEYPLLLYLHGGDLGYHRSGGYTPWANELNGFDEAYAEIIAEAIDDCIIFVPQAPGAPREVKDAVGAYWSGMPTGMVGSATEDKSESSPYLRAVEKMMADFLEKGISHSSNVYIVDASRLYVTGHSMGAIGTYTILRDCPDMFAAAIIGAGIGDPATADSWKDTPVRIYHGTNDKVIPYESTMVMAAELENNEIAEIRTLEGVGHSIQPYMYLIMNEEGKSESFSWMAEQSREVTVSPQSTLSFYYIGAAVIVVAIAMTWIVKRRTAKE